MRRLSHTAKPADGQKKDTSKGAPTAEAPSTYATTQEKKNQKQRISHRMRLKRKFKSKRMLILLITVIILSIIIASLIPETVIMAFFIILIAMWLLFLECG